MLNNEKQGLEFDQEHLKQTQLEAFSDGPPSLPSSYAIDINQQSPSSSNYCDKKFLGCQIRYTVILMNIILMSLALATVVAWSWNSHWMGASLGVAVLCIHSVLWLNIFFFQRLLLYMIFLVAYAVFVVLEVIYVIVFLIIAYTQRLSVDSTNNSNEQLSVVVVLMLLLAGLIILIIGSLLEVAVYKLLQLEGKAPPGDENRESRQEIMPEAILTKEILTTTQAVMNGQSALKECWMISQFEKHVFSKEFPNRRLSCL